MTGRGHVVNCRALWKRRRKSVLVFIQITFFIQVVFLKEGMLHNRLSPDKFKSLEMGYVLNFVGLSLPPAKQCGYAQCIAAHTVEIISC
jgi:hypothetical protein